MFARVPLLQSEQAKVLVPSEAATRAYAWSRRFQPPVVSKMRFGRREDHRSILLGRSPTSKPDVLQLIRIADQVDCDDTASTVFDGIVSIEPSLSRSTKLGAH